MIVITCCKRLHPKLQRSGYRHDSQKDIYGFIVLKKDGVWDRVGGRQLFCRNPEDSNKYELFKLSVRRTDDRVEVYMLTLVVS